MSARDCPRFDSCSAPICPMEPASLVKGTWFPAEDQLCKLEKYGRTPLVSRQRKIARATRGMSYRESGVFASAMIEHPCVIRRGFRGLDPEEPASGAAVRKWIAGRARIVPRPPPEGGLRTRWKAGAAAPVGSAALDVESPHPAGDIPSNTASGGHRLSMPMAAEEVES